LSIATSSTATVLLTVAADAVRVAGGVGLDSFSFELVAQFEYLGVIVSTVEAATPIIANHISLYNIIRDTNEI